MVQLNFFLQKHRKSCMIIILICLVIVTFSSINRETLSFNDFMTKPNNVTKVKPVKKSESATPKPETFPPSTGDALVKKKSDSMPNDYKSSSQQLVLSSKEDKIIKTTSTQPNSYTQRMPLSTYHMQQHNPSQDVRQSLNLNHDRIQLLNQSHVNKQVFNPSHDHRQALNPSHNRRQAFNPSRGRRLRILSKFNEVTSEEMGIQLNKHTKNIDFKNVEDIMITKPIEFLPSYKNPCWIGTHDNGPINDDKLHCLPYFYLIGVKKSGTTDLFGRLLANPYIISPDFKEAQWFARLRFRDSVVPRYLRRILKKGSKYDQSELSFYVSLFDQAAKTITARGARVRASINPFITAEASPSNLHKSLYWEHMPGNEGLTEPKYTTLHNIKHLNPNVKIIIIFRDPVERSYSDYIHASLIGNKYASAEKFHNVTQTLVKSYQACFSRYAMRRCLYNFTWIKELQVETSSYMDFQAGFYAFYMKELWNVFGKDHVLPLLMKDYAEDKEGTLNKVFRFLNLSVYPSSQNMLHNTKRNNHAAAKKRSGLMLAETKSILYDFFKPYNLEMSEVMEDSRYLFPQPLDILERNSPQSNFVKSS